MDYKAVTKKVSQSLKETGQFDFNSYFNELFLMVSIAYPGALGENLKKSTKDEVLKLFLGRTSPDGVGYEYIEKTGIIKKKRVKLN